MVGKNIELKISEDQLQRQCVKWFRMQYPQYLMRMFAIPNGGKRDAITATKMKQTGTLAGTWDLLLSVPRRGYSGLFIEMKVGKNNLSDHQRDFRKAHGDDYAFAICKTLDAFMKVINLYLKEN